MLIYRTDLPVVFFFNNYLVTFWRSIEILAMQRFIGAGTTETKKKTFCSMPYNISSLEQA